MKKIITILLILGAFQTSFCLDFNNLFTVIDYKSYPILRRVAKKQSEQIINGLNKDNLTPLQYAIIEKDYTAYRILLRASKDKIEACTGPDVTTKIVNFDNHIPWAKATSRIFKPYLLNPNAQKLAIIHYVAINLDTQQKITYVSLKDVDLVNKLGYDRIASQKNQELLQELTYYTFT